MVSTGPEVGRLSMLQDLPDLPSVGSGPLVVCSMPFARLCPLSRFPFLLCLSNMPLFSVFRGFLAGFGVRMYICMGLGFCVDCRAFVCVRG